MKKVSVVDEVSPFLYHLNDKEMKKALKSTSRKIVSSGVKVIKAEYKKTGIKHVPQKGGYGNPQKGIKGRVLNNPLWVSLTIMGDFRLKWFEKGTKKRRTRKGGYNRGKITATPFFVLAINQFKSQIEAIYKKAFNGFIIEIINKKQKWRKI